MKQAWRSIGTRETKKHSRVGQNDLRLKKKNWKCTGYFTVAGDQRSDRSVLC